MTQNRGKHEYHIYLLKVVLNDFFTQRNDLRLFTFKNFVLTVKSNTLAELHKPAKNQKCKYPRQSG